MSRDILLTDILLTGTPVTETASRVLRAGALEATLDSGALRWIRWNGVEVLRGVLFLLRTPGWGTPFPKVSGLSVDSRADGFTVSYLAHYGAPGAGVQVAIRLSGASMGKGGGQIRAEAHITAEAPFETNRTGFVILHPLDGFAGTEVRVDHASGSTRDLVIPAQISPGQPVMDIRAITHHPAPGLHVETRFEGDIFEMEDHRNWSDASFKTYSRPIALPFPYLLQPAQPLFQAVTVALTDDGHGGAVGSAVAVPEIAGQRLPDYALPLDRLADAGAALQSKAIAALKPGWFLLRYDTANEASDPDFAPMARLLSQTGARLEVQAILDAASDAAGAAQLAALAAHLARAGITPARISAFAKIDEQSFQPGQPRPPHPAEAALAQSLAQHFPQAAHIGGSPAFFTEFNRKRPDPALWRGLSFATTPVVHAADDASVMETLQALPHILTSATALAAGLPLLIGPTGIGARINPYGTGPVQNAPEAREGMAARDPRQRGLYAAAWTVGYLVRIAPFAPLRFAFGGATGPFGLVSEGTDYPRPWWEDQPDGTPYPLWHIAHVLALAAGGSLVQAETRAGIAYLSWRKDGRRHLLAANLTAGPQPLSQPLSQSLFQSAPASAPGTGWLLDADHITAPVPIHARPATLDAWAVIFQSEEEGAA
ncbi:hypothetical protein HOY34_16735 [Xinfangfangia sp. D13-10-4-6]|uniref:hypothetical protein n=1 Tax=Pseudogemmobacter hezensis TaxID=2737662 RepID=UPI001554E627|nr:hypothetical protein [Pseudogemmobacter hezensis]NPD16841.1 hypothetical protein [Pseudogemmobacter hezensis]